MEPLENQEKKKSKSSSKYILKGVIQKFPTKTHYGRIYPSEKSLARKEAIEYLLGI